MSDRLCLCPALVPHPFPKTLYITSAASGIKEELELKTKLAAFINNKRKAVLSAALVLFLLLALSFPFATGVTFAGSGDSANHTLTYQNGHNLFWDSDTVVTADGVGVLDFFTAAYGSTVESANGDKLIAPGTNGRDTIRLSNRDYDTLEYTAVIYRISDKGLDNVTATLSAKGSKRAWNYTLPDSAKGAKVLGAVTGKVSGGQIQDFAIDWNWAFSPSSSRDKKDTKLGNKKDLDNVELGFYIVVTDLNDVKVVPKPKTGDSFTIVLYIALMVISLFVFIYILFIRRRDEEEENTASAPVNPANLN